MHTSDSENLRSLRKEFDPADLEAADTTMNETGEDTLDDEEVISDLSSLDESMMLLDETQEYELV